MQNGLETEKIELNTLKLAQPKPPESVKRPAENYPTATQPPLGLPRLPAYQRLATEIPGRELAPEAQVWQLYVEEAKEYDSELVEGENKNLDLMLLFAALFSAILTAFIIESKSLLQQDPSDVSIALLLQIAQSQQRMEQGTPQVLPPIEIPNFSASGSARWINGLWFTALALSLAAALIAMLAKEWLTAFTASRPRPPHAYALLHHRRLRGLKQWGALHMIDLLPSMLHLSLLLFSLGLAVYLWSLDSGIAIAEAVVTGITAIFYVGTALLGALYQSCPFVTQISKYMRASFAALNLVQNSQSSSKDIAGQTTDEEMDALLWLIETARDPAVADYACQALIGLRLSVSSGSSTQGESGSSVHEDEKIADENKNEGSTVPAHGQPCSELRRNVTLRSFYDNLFVRTCEAQAHLYQELMEHRGLNMAQLASALPVVVQYLEPNISEGGLNSPAEHHAEALLPMLDFVWSTACSELVPDCYAAFIAAELRILVLLTIKQHLKQIAITESVSSTETGNGGSTVINIPNITSSESASALFELRARYTRALVRTGLLLKYHSLRGMPISTRPLIRLLEAIRLAALCKELNLDSHMSTCHPQSWSTPQLLPYFNINVTPNNGHFMPPLDIGDADKVTSGIIRLVGPAAIDNSASLERAAINALHAVFPMLARQWIHMMSRLPDTPLSQESERMRSVQVMLEKWPSDHAPDQPEEFNYWITSQLLLVSAISVSLADHEQYMSYLPRVATEALYQKGSAQSSHSAMRGVMYSNDDDMKQLIKHACLHVDLFTRSREAAKSVIGLFGITDSDGAILAPICLYGSSLPHIFKLISKTDHDLSGTARILAGVSSDARYIIWLFTSQPEQLIELSSLGEQNSYTPCVVECIFSIIGEVHVQITADELSGEVLPEVVPPILRAVLLVVKNLADKDMARLKVFISKFLEICDLLSPAAQLELEGHPSLSAVFETLNTPAEADDELKDLMTELEEWKYGTWAMRGLTWLYDMPNEDNRGPQTSRVPRGPD